MLVDSHCHLDFPDFAEERDAVVQRARDKGVQHFLTICTHLRQADSIIAVADAYPDVSASIGTHPHYASEELDLGKSELLRLHARPKVVAIGECGLDYHYNHSAVEDQHIIFRQHIEAAMETDLPLIIHTREAEADTMRLLREVSAGGKVRGVLHCFTSSIKLAEEALDFGFMVSFSGILTFKNAVEIREAAKIVPLDRLLVETDAPYLAPIPNRGKRNEPAFVTFTAEALAVIKEVPTQQLAEHTTRNFFSLFDRAVQS
jgi:TatD DNase family protein